MGYRVIITFILFFIYTSQASSQGLYIKGNNSLIDDRTSYNVFDKVTPTFKNILKIDFDLIVEEPRSRGSLVRIKNEKIGAVYNISYNGEGNNPVFKLNHEGRNTLIFIALDKDILNENQWIKIHVEFNMQKDSVKLRINNDEASVGLMQEEKIWKPEIYFGRSEHVIDVPPFKLCNLTITDNEKAYNFPLNESEGEEVHDSNRKVVGHVTNPVWLINDAYYWKGKPSFSSEAVAGSNFNAETQDIYYFNSDSIIIYNIRTETIRSRKYTNECPMPMRLGTNFIDYKNNRLYIYEVADPPQGDIVISYLDLQSYEWTAVTSEVLPMQLHHHSNYMDTPNGHYIIFGGFGGISYFNNFYSFDLSSQHWKKLNFKGDVITPRYFTSMGYNESDKSLYVFGGMGNKAGDQTVGRVYYYELYKINLDKHIIEKLWEIPWEKENVVPVRNMVFSNDNSFYTLCYPEHFSRSHLKLYRFSITDGQYEVLGDSIPIRSEKITTNANLYYNSRANELVSIVQEFENNDIGSTAKIYTISFPPVTEAELTLYISKPINWEHTIILSALGLIILALIFFFLRRQNIHKKETERVLKNTPLVKSEMKEDDIPVETRPNSIYLFGEFSLIDRNNREINYMLSAKLRQAFFLILNHSIKKGITSQEFSEYLWPNKSYEKAKNSRGVTLNNLRKILGDLDGVNLIHEKGIYKITFSDECYCDYLRCLEIVLGENLDENMNEFISIISRGKFLETEDSSIQDSFKEYIESKIESTIYYYMEKTYMSGNYSATVSLCDSFFNLDPLDEETLHYLIMSLSKLELKDEAKRRYYFFTAEYKKALGEEYSKSFSDLLK
ncbi:DNA-binding transcriptional activator [Dysgonomonas sp. 521]|uniref:Kelch repeat-containing protein n=1 Tax=Dysgonomonas sp. 521 TaxID=2302932 RepID=UPI0013D467C6|nr:kelch repeat-containing protein [Dysgonomonas sp. 521]NDV96375.1 DNA-binding transcriptional activator [Dysgonomonas sp. 521]